MSFIDIFVKVPQYSGTFNVNASMEETLAKIKGLYKGLTGLVGVPTLDTPFASVGWNLTMSDAPSRASQAYSLRVLSPTSCQVTIIARAPKGNARATFNSIQKSLTK
jgi:hypothetical protein